MNNDGRNDEMMKEMMKKGICVDEWIKIWFEKIEEKSHSDGEWI